MPLRVTDPASPRYSSTAAGGGSSPLALKSAAAVAAAPLDPSKTINQTFAPPHMRLHPEALAIVPVVPVANLPTGAGADTSGGGRFEATCVLPYADLRRGYDQVVASTINNISSGKLDDDRPHGLDLNLVAFPVFSVVRPAGTGDEGEGEGRELHLAHDTIPVAWTNSIGRLDSVSVNSAILSADSCFPIKKEPAVLKKKSKGEAVVDNQTAPPRLVSYSCAELTAHDSEGILKNFSRIIIGATPSTTTTTVTSTQPLRISVQLSPKPKDPLDAEKRHVPLFTHLVVCWRIGAPLAAQEVATQVIDRCRAAKENQSRALEALRADLQQVIAQNQNSSGDSSASASVSLLPKLCEQDKTCRHYYQKSHTSQCRHTCRHSTFTTPEGNMEEQGGNSRNGSPTLPQQKRKHCCSYLADAQHRKYFIHPVKELELFAREVEVRASLRHQLQRTLVSVGEEEEQAGSGDNSRGKRSRDGATGKNEDDDDGFGDDDDDEEEDDVPSAAKTSGGDNTTTSAAGGKVVELGASLVPVRCPLSFMRITVPVRGIHCSHDACFDLHWYIQGAIQGGGSWLCPVCLHAAYPAELEIDCIVQEALKALEDDDDVTHIRIDHKNNNNNNQQGSTGTASSSSEQQQLWSRYDEVAEDEARLQRKREKRQKQEVAGHSCSSPKAKPALLVVKPKPKPLLLVVQKTRPAVDLSNNNNNSAAQKKLPPPPGLTIQASSPRAFATTKPRTPQSIMMDGSPILKPAQKKKKVPPSAFRDDEDVVVIDD